MKKALQKTFIAAIITISLSACKEPSTTGLDSSDTAAARDSVVNSFLDEWHRAAARADSTVFFGSMTENSIYIGTDATERWKKHEFMEFAMPFFARGRAWDFKPYDRDLHVTNDGKMVWFSELLTTWMGVCRGSGVLRLTNEGWKIEQYHLSVTVPNDAIQDFITLIDNFNGAKK